MTATPATSAPPDFDVTIITPIYNARRWLPALFETTRAQQYQAFEHILIDDLSTDGSVEEAERLAAGDPRVRILKMPRNSGPAAARNLGIAQAKGRYIAFLDADDLWLPEKLARQVAWMKETGYAFTYHDYRHLSHDGAKLGARVCGPDVLDLRTHHIRRGTGGCLSVMVDMAQLPAFRFPDLQRSLPEDFLAWLWILQQGHLGHRLALDLGRYRLVPASRSSNKLAAAFAVWRLYHQVEKLPLVKATWWWLLYAWNTRRLYKQAEPR